LVKAKFTTEDLDLMLDLGQNGEMVGVDENVLAVLQRSQQRQRLLKVEIDALRGLLDRWRHAGERSVRAPEAVRGAKKNP
jgi:hypothetical protein